MASQIKLRRGTASEWSSYNPTLSEGEAGFETDTNRLKIGDGNTSWNSLNYLIADIDLSAYLTISSASTTYATKVELSEIDLSDYLTISSASITYAEKVLPIVVHSGSGTYSLTLNDVGKLVEINGQITVRVPQESNFNVPIGTQINLLNIADSLVTIEGDPGIVTVNATPGLKLRAQWSGATLIKRGYETWVLIGDLKA